LEILAAGALEVRPRVQPIFDVLGRRTVWLDRVGEGSRLKLALNNWLVVLVEAMCETLTFSEALGLEPHVFLEAIAGGPLASAYAMAKGTAMLDEDFVPGFPLRHAVKTPSLPRALPAGMGCNSRSLMRCCRAGVKPSSKATVTRTPPRPLPAPPRPPVARHEPDFDRHVTISEDAASRVAKNAKYLGVSEQIAPILSDRTVVQLKSSATH
jgi:hypothetical protein